MDIKDLRYFMAVYEAKGFARAGVSLHTVQSNVSARIKKLETCFGARLFERRRHGIAVTEQGEALYGYAKRLIALADELENAVKGKPPVRRSAGTRYAGAYRDGELSPRTDLHSAF